MIALNMLEQELGIEDTDADIEVLLEELVGKDNLDELNNDVSLLCSRFVLKLPSLTTIIFGC